MADRSILAKLEDEALGAGIDEVWREFAESYRYAVEKSLRLSKEMSDYISRASQDDKVVHAEVQYLTDSIAKQTREMEVIGIAVEAWESVRLRQDGQDPRDLLIQIIHRELAEKARTPGMDQRLLMELGELADHLGNTLYIQVRHSGPS